MNEIKFAPIAVVKGQRTKNVDDYWGGCVSEIVFARQLDLPEALTGLDQFSHLEVIYHFHQLDPSKNVPSTNHPRDRRDLPRIGIFAQRRSLRPNRIGTSICRLLEVRTDRVIVEGLDALDGSPVLDVKPYIREFGPRGRQSQPQWSSEIMTEYYARQMPFAPPDHWPNLQTDRLILRLQTEIRPDEMFGYWLRNRDFFELTNPSFPESFFSREHFVRQNIEAESQFEAGTSLRMVICKRSQDRIPIGTVVFPDIVRGPMQACKLGYTLDKNEQGAGYMTEALWLATDYMFETHKIQRIAACYMVGNEKSAQVLERLKFEKEGVSPSFLFVAGKWRDHVQTSKLNRRQVAPG